jgi:hypothetical protein
MPGDGCETPLDTLTDCGACDAACGFSNASPVCVSMTCALGVCDPGFGNCDGVDGTGCEDTLDSPANCGGCGVVCARDNATVTCAGVRCALGLCLDGFGNCDGMDDTGCEDTLDSLVNCGACGSVCARNNATATCAGDTCAIASCNAGFGNCDGMDATGCEAPLNTTVNCGACGNACGPGQSCVSGACVSAPSVVQVGAGTSFACARISDGRVYCWGSNSEGQLGNGTMTNSAVPMQVLRFNAGSTGGTTALVDATDLAVGGLHACAVRATGGVVCWGYTQKGQAGGGMAGGGGFRLRRAGPPPWH